MCLEKDKIPKNIFLWLLRKSRDNEMVTVHANTEKTIAGSRHYIHAEDVAEALLFLHTSYDISSMQT